MKTTRRAMLWTFGAVTLGAAVARALPVAGGFEQVEHEVGRPGRAPAHAGLQVAHLTDLHVGDTTPDGRLVAAARALVAASPDLVVLTGDFVTTGRDPVSRVGELMALLPAVPRVAVLGNHDHWTKPAAITARLEAEGIAVLHNQHTTVRLRGAGLSAIGVADARTRQDDARAAVKGLPDAGSRLVLTHAPTAADALPPLGTVCLSGHTHGGHFVVPGLTRGAMALGGQRYVRGWYQVGGNQLYVSRGIGAGGAGVPRLGANPEVTLLTLRRGDGTGSLAMR